MAREKKVTKAQMGSKYKPDLIKNLSMKMGEENQVCSATGGKSRTNLNRRGMSTQLYKRQLAVVFGLSKPCFCFKN